ncbi:MAG: inner membrane-spanning protein YciB [Paracoccaceae bacterium]
MSENKKNSSITTSLLEIGPVIIFFLVFIWRNGETVVIGGQEYSSLIQATAIFVPLMILSTGLGWWINGHLSKIQVLTLVLVIVFGAMTVFLNDERFFKMKPTLIYVLFGAALSFGLMRGQNYIEALMGDKLVMQSEGWAIIAKRLTAFFFALAVLNELVWRTQSSETWVYFKTFGLSGAVMLFMLFQVRVFMKYGDLEEK